MTFALKNTTTIKDGEADSLHPLRYQQNNLKLAKYNNLSSRDCSHCCHQNQRRGDENDWIVQVLRVQASPPVFALNHQDPSSQGLYSDIVFLTDS